MNILRDIDCTADTPVALGKPKRRIYGQGHYISPRYPGKRLTAADKKIYLERRLPLEEYDHILVLYSGGKDSTAAFFSLIEMGVPKEKIQLWHHDLDGGHPSRLMDWPVTKPYVKSFAKAEGVKLQVSQRVNGFWGEVYRIGSPYPIEYEQDGMMVTTPLSAAQKSSETLRREIMESMSGAGLPEDSAALSRLWCSQYEELLLDEMLSYDLYDLGRFAYVGQHPGERTTSKEAGGNVFRNIRGLKEKASHLRLPQKRASARGRFCTGRCKNDVGDAVIRDKFRLTGAALKVFDLKERGYHLRLPAKGSCMDGRYCTSVGKAKVYEKVMRHHQDTKEGVKILVVSGERRGESINRSKYNEIEISPCNATANGKRLVHHWRLVIDYHETDIWEVLRRHRCVPHPCYSLGWNRCSCAMCIFSKREQWAGIRELFPDLYEEICQDEIRLGFTLNVYQTLNEYVGEAKSCVYHGDPKAMRQMLNGVFKPEDLYTKKWRYPAGAFHGSEGGPC